MLAIIMCTYNRCNLTERCIESLLIGLKKANVSNYKFFVCDDASTDDTVSIIKQKIPRAHIFITKGNMYWSKSMHIAMKMAKECNPDIYLMINDDVIFDENVIEVMLRSFDKTDKKSGIVGTTVARNSKTCTYGGRFLYNESELVKPQDILVECEVANWNCFLLPKQIVETVGLVDRHYAHGCGDYDYCIRMKKHGYKIYVANDIVGKCDRNGIENTYRDINLGRYKRIQHLLSPKGYPFFSYLRYTYRRGGIKSIPNYLWSYALQIIKVIF